MSAIVVADAGPLHYLILIDAAEFLERLFDEVCIPQAVKDELSSQRTPEEVKKWISHARTWLKVYPNQIQNNVPSLHRGEAEAIELALTIKAGALLIDDLDGRKQARSRGLDVIGTVGLLERAAEKDLLALPEVIAKLRQTNFFASPALLNAALERDRLRRARQKGI